MGSPARCDQLRLTARGMFITMAVGALSLLGGCGHDTSMPHAHSVVSDTVPTPTPVTPQSIESRRWGFAALTKLDGQVPQYEATFVVRNQTKHRFAISFTVRVNDDSGIALNLPFSVTLNGGETRTSNQPFQSATPLVPSTASIGELSISRPAN